MAGGSNALDDPLGSLRVVSRNQEFVSWFRPLLVRDMSREVTFNQEFHDPVGIGMAGIMGT
jgi:hypothetical protein